MREDITAKVLEWLQEYDGTKPWAAKTSIYLERDEDKFAVFPFKIVAAFPDTIDFSPQEWVSLHDTVNPASPVVAIPPAKLITRQSSLAEAFAQAYLGGNTIPADFEARLITCWSVYLNHHGTFPCVSMLQSSGFGKSRLLQELAQRVLLSEEMRVLYVCVREGDSSGYPKRTAAWPDALFPSVYHSTEGDLQQELTALLVLVYRNARATWDTVGAECLQHFHHEQAGATTYHALTKEVTPPFPSVIRPTPNTNRVLVLALDDAKWMVETSVHDRTGWFLRLKRALSVANWAIAKQYGHYAGILAVLVDTDSKVTTVSPPITKDPSSLATDGSTLLSPFILTHTMDIFLDRRIREYYDATKNSSGCDFYRSLVHAPDQRSYLVDMGRPLWQLYKVWVGRGVGEQQAWGSLINLAKNKLFSGRIVSDINPNSLDGIGALLCRVGLRPSSWCPQALRFVLNSMATLSHVNFRQEQVITTYASEPELAFGAACVWHSPMPGGQTLLETSILPSLRRLLHQEVLDAGGSGEMVARIVLLLAMDATGAVASRNSHGREYVGDFYDVNAFIRTLGWTACVNSNRDPKPTAPELLAPWMGWKVGFSHFVQLTKEPTREVLWALLARRAACALPCDFEGVELLIPISRGDDVSMILIQVKNRQRDSNMADAALIATRPELAFKGELKELAGKCLRVYMSLRATETMERYYWVADTEAKQGKTSVAGEEDDVAVASEAPADSFVLCLLGLGAWGIPVDMHGAFEPQVVTVVSAAVAASLRSMLTPWVKVEALVQADLAARTGSHSDMLATAMKPLVETVIENKWADLVPAARPRDAAHEAEIIVAATASKMPKLE